MRAVIYTRVSQDPDKELRSVDKQEDECRAYCRSQGWEVARVFCDNDRGASRHSRKARPEYVALRDFLDAGGADVLVLWESSRAQRDITAYASLRDLCAERGILYSYSGRTYDMTRTDDRFATGLDALLAERESDVVSDRVRLGVSRNAHTGRPHGKLPYGYGREYDDRGNFVRQYIKEDQAVVIREAAARVVAGESIYAISQDFNAREVPAPRGGLWLPTQVLRLLTNPRYVGQRVHGGKVIGPAVWPAILGDDLWLEVQAILKDPRRKKVRDTSLKHLLSGVLRCGPCGGPMRVQTNRGYLTYMCTAKFCTAVRSTKVEECVVAVALERLSRPDFLAAVAARAARPGQQEDGTPDQLQQRLDGFYAAAAAGDLSPGALAAIERRLLPEIEAARAREIEAVVPPVLRQVAGADIRDRWPALSLGTQRTVIDTLMTIKVNKGVRGKLFTPERLTIEWKSI